MAKVLYSFLCRELKKDNQTGNYLPFRTIHSFELVDFPVLFTFMVYWAGEVGEGFEQSFALVDDAGSVLDEMPKMECVLTSRYDNIGAGFFYAIFPRVGRYTINIFVNGVCIEDFTFDVLLPRAPILP